MFNEKTYCILPWSSIQINPSGDFKVCCFSGQSNETDSKAKNHGMCIDKDGKFMNVLTHTIQDALNSKYHKEIRLAQSKNERHTMCKVCWDRDDANDAKNQVTSSLRYFRTFRQLPNLDNAIPIHKAQDTMLPDGSIENYPISLDLRFTNVCNMKCIMCSSIYSNQWYDDEIKLYGNRITINSEPWHDSSIWWKQFDEIKHRIRHLYLTGGEPFIVKGHDIMLDKLIESNLASEIILEYDTNLSVINDKIIDRLRHFKQVIISVSCDDINEQYELIRFPGKFKTISSNLEKLKDRNIKIRHISSCIGIYSLYSPMRVYDHFTKLGYDGETKLTSLDAFSFRLLRFPAHSNIALLPKALKLKMIDVYENSTLPQRWKLFLIGYLENYLDTYSKETCDKSVYEHIDYLNKLDNIRGTDWKKTFPEIVELLKDYL